MKMLIHELQLQRLIGLNFYVKKVESANLPAELKQNGKYWDTCFDIHTFQEFTLLTNQELEGNSINKVIENGKIARDLRMLTPKEKRLIKQVEKKEDRTGDLVHADLTRIDNLNQIIEYEGRVKVLESGEESLIVTDVDKLKTLWLSRFLFASKLEKDKFYYIHIHGEKLKNKVVYFYGQEFKDKIVSVGKVLQISEPINLKTIQKKEE